MADLLHIESGDLSAVADPDVRRVLRQLQHELDAVLSRQQMEIDALLEMMMEKNISSLGEFKRHLLRLQQNRSRGNRIHEALDAAAPIPIPARDDGPSRIESRRIQISDHRL